MSFLRLVPFLALTSACTGDLRKVDCTPVQTQVLDDIRELTSRAYEAGFVDEEALRKRGIDAAVVNEALWDNDFVCAEPVGEEGPDAESDISRSEVRVNMEELEALVDIYIENPNLPKAWRNSNYGNTFNLPCDQDFKEDSSPFYAYLYEGSDTFAHEAAHFEYDRLSHPRHNDLEDLNYVKAREVREDPIYFAGTTWQTGVHDFSQLFADYRYCEPPTV